MRTTTPRLLGLVFLTTLAACGGSPTPPPGCGDGTTGSGEACDDGNTTAGDGCGSTCALETGFTCSGTPSACATTCGDGVTAGAEACDDGNTTAGDGCSTSCAVEAGFTCTGAPSACAPTCGDGTLAGAEACDDGDTTAGDGCSASCAVESGYACTGEPSTCAPTCGDGALAGAEACDDSNPTSGDGCSASCAVETGYTCTGAPSTCTPACGDGLLAGAEGCDDANTMADDGCGPSCTSEAGWTCTGAPSVCIGTCGDGLKVGTEGCDDDNTTAGDGCSATCAVESGFTCTGTPSVCVTSCGDGLIGGAEGCDDGNTSPGDGCSATCAVESGFACTGTPSVCATACGDGVLAGTEACDDGNTSGLDGCSALCAIETGWSCTGAPSTCATTCGDGLRAGAESCDDGNTTGGDGCSATCGGETGWSCSGSPSVCNTICGDGLLVGTEACDDSDTMGNDGCSATCTVENGWACSGSPSTCVPVCGDTVIVGPEQCDDGNTVPDDGCTASCRYPTGESCSEPLVLSRGQPLGPGTQWIIPSGGVTVADGAFACDTSGSGPDVVIKYVKTSGTVAGGGSLLHVRATPTVATTTPYYLNVEVTSGSCSPAGRVEKCAWYKHDWDVWLDVPAGTYYVWVAKNSAATPTVLFPETDVFIEEAAATAALAQGEGCFAPFTTSSANYTPPAMAGAPHTWALPANINSYDRGISTGGPGSISCDGTSPAPIHGVDAVIAVAKASAATVLLVQAQNVDPVLTQSDLNVELTATCDALAPMAWSRNCRWNQDTVEFTAPAPAGTSYVWVSTEATSEEFNGATVQVTELAAGVGETWGTAELLTGSSSIVPTSTLRYDVPSCLPATGNVHWYRFVSTQDVVRVSAVGAGPVGVLDEHGQEISCAADAQAVPQAAFVPAGTPVYLAVPVGGAVTGLTLQTFAYSGLQGSPVDLRVTFPTSATSEYGMAVSASTLYMGDTTSVFEIPKAGGATAVERGTAEGITATHLGYDLVSVGGRLFSVDSTTTTTASRLFRIYDGSAWGPTAWDVTPAYPATSGSYAVATDGNLVFLATRNTSTTTGNVTFYSFSQAMPGVPALLGTNTSVRYAVGLAADANYFYVAGVSMATAQEGIFRIARSNLAAPAVQLAALNTSTLHSSVVVDSLTAPNYLYARDATGDIHVVQGPAGAAPAHLGARWTLGSASDYSMTFDHAQPALYFFETETDAAGVIRRVQ
ncbi:MAG: DUF4215 domain-containing protein [Myxococcales bacterium]|nr:DUF4215 domain-containing protein [Myxococcales bacterium]